jgi:TonB family protein
MFELKTSAQKSNQPLLTLPAPAASREQNQRRMMTVALVLLLIALAVVLYRDRDFWFPPDTQEADDQLQPVPARPSAADSLADQPAVAAKSVTATKTLGRKSLPKKSSASEQPKVLASNAAPVAQPAAGFSATTTRTVLPPLEVEVVAGDNHSRVHPGTNSVHVDLQPGSPPRPVANSSAGTDPSTTASVTLNASERMQMSSGTAEVVSKPVQPGYPLLARQMKVQGSVILQALIGRDGTIQNLHVLSGPPILAAAAQEAVRQWRFKPHYLNNEPVETQADITVNFTISTN